MPLFDPQPTIASEVAARNLAGFTNSNSDTTLTWTNGTRTVTVAPTGTSFTVWANNTGYTFTGAQTVVISNTVGQHFVVFDATGALTESTTTWDITSDQIAPVATVYWDGTNGAINDERHSAQRDRWNHADLHNTRGTAYQNGLAGNFNNSNFSIAPGNIFDEELKLALPNTYTTCRLWYRKPGATEMTFESGVANVYKASGTSLQYDNGGTLTTVTTTGGGSYVTNWVYATDDLDYPIYCVVSQAQYSTLALARAATAPTLPNITTREWKLIYTVIYRNPAGVAAFIEATDYRTVSTLPGAVVTSLPAASVTFTPITGITATNVQAAFAQVAPLTSGVADGASAVGVTFDTAVTYSTAGSKLLSLKNNTVEKFWVDYAGYLSAGGFYIRSPGSNGSNRIYPSGTQSNTNQIVECVADSDNLNSPSLYFGISNGDGWAAPISCTFMASARNGTGTVRDFHLWAQNTPSSTNMSFTMKALTNLIGINQPTPLAALHVRSVTADGATAIASLVDTSTTWANASAKLLSIRNNGSEKLGMAVSGALTLASTVTLSTGNAVYWGSVAAVYADANSTLNVRGNVTDGATAVGVVLNTDAALSNAAAKLVSIRNAGVEKSYFDKDGKLSTPALLGTPVAVSNISATGTPSSSTYLRGDGAWSAANIVAPYTLSGVGDTVPFTINAISGQTANLQSWKVNGAEKAYIDKDGNFFVTASTFGSATSGVTLSGNAANASGAVGTILDNRTTFTLNYPDLPRLVSVRNHGAEKFSVNYLGETTVLGGSVFISGLPAAPTQAPTYVSQTGGGGVPDGDWVYRIRYTWGSGSNAGVTAVGPISDPITASSGGAQITLGNIEISPDPRVNGREVLRAPAGATDDSLTWVTLNFNPNDNVNTTYVDTNGPFGTGGAFSNIRNPDAAIFGTSQYAGVTINSDASVALQSIDVTFGLSLVYGTAGSMADFGPYGALIDGMTVGMGASRISSNTAVGFDALVANTTGDQNTAVGYQALTVNTTGAENTAVGWSSLWSNTTGSYNTAIGRRTMYYAEAADNNVALGYAALRYTRWGNDNTALGAEAFGVMGSERNSTQLLTGHTYQILTPSTFDWTTVGAADSNVGTVFVATGAGDDGGAYAWPYNESNVAVGRHTGDGFNDIVQNTIVGAYAGMNQVGGDNNIIIGYNAVLPNASVSNQTVIGNSSTTSSMMWGAFTSKIGSHVMSTDGAVSGGSNGHLRIIDTGYTQQPYIEVSNFNIKFGDAINGYAEIDSVTGSYYGDWDSGTTYSIDQRVNWNGGYVYTSLQNSNLNHAPTLGGDSWWAESTAGTGLTFYSNLAADEQYQPDFHFQTRTRTAGVVFDVVPQYGTFAITYDGIVRIPGAIEFGSGGYAKSDMYTLDRYAEYGSDTINNRVPYILFGTNYAGITYSTETGGTTTIGDMEFLNLSLVLTSKGSNTGTATIAGGPVNPPLLPTPCTVYTTGLSITSGNVIQAYLGTDSVIYLTQVSPTGTATALTNANFSNTSTIQISCMYQIAST